LEPALHNTEELIKFIDDANAKIWRLRGTGTVDFDPQKLLTEAFEKAISINYRQGIAQCTLSKGMGAFILENNVDLSFKLINEAIEIFKELDNKKWIANSLLTMAILSTSSGKPETGLYHALRGIEYYNHNREDEQDVVMAYYVIGTVYKDLKKLDEAEKYYNIGAAHHAADGSWNGRIYTSLSNIYNERGEYKKALEFGERSLKILNTEQNLVGLSRVLNDIGNIYKKLKNYDSAFDYFFRGLKIREEGTLKHFALGSLIDIASTYIEIGNTQEAINFLLRAEPIAVEVGHQTRLTFIYQKLAELYKSIDHLKESINYYEKFIKLTIEINLKERETKIDNLQSAVVQEKEQEIERLRNVELKNAYELISEKNKEITDSIHYALRIQKALLASDDLLKKHLPEFFVFYQPKDIVSGDFYWGTSSGSGSMLEVSGSVLEVTGSVPGNKKPGTGNREYFYLAVCDSTGHGVPGAFMSLLNITFLNEAINEKNISEPHLVLNHVRERLISAVSQDGGKDGMDGTLVCFEPPSPCATAEAEGGTRLEKGGGMRLTYSSANNSPLLISNGKITNLPADKMPIGKGEKSDSFTLHTHQLQKGDMLYLYTDGYADQFGGPRGKKFKYKQLHELLLSVSGKPLNQQSEILNRNFSEWKAELEQVDDVLLIGIKI